MDARVVTGITGARMLPRRRLRRRSPPLPPERFDHAPFPPSPPHPRAFASEAEGVERSEHGPEAPHGVDREGPAPVTEPARDVEAEQVEQDERPDPDGGIPPLPWCLALGHAHP